jgi:hypothetical protein
MTAHAQRSNNRSTPGLRRNGPTHSLALMFCVAACAGRQRILHSEESVGAPSSVAATPAATPLDSAPTPVAPTALAPPRSDDRYDPPMIDPRSASLEALKEYTRDPLGVGPTVPSEAIAASPEAYISKLAGAPAVVPTHYFLYGFKAMVYERSCPESNCYIDVYGPNILAKFDYQGVSDDVRNLLAGAGYQVAFAGLSSGELYITSRPTQTANSTARYYQIRFAARPCDGRLEWSDPCGIYGDASLIGFTRQNGDSPVSYSVDELCLRIEAAALNEVWRAIRRSAQARSPARHQD